MAVKQDKLEHLRIIENHKVPYETLARSIHLCINGEL